MAADPNGDALVALPNNVRIAIDLAGHAVNRDGRIAVRTILPDSWYWGAAILDPSRGRLDAVPGWDRADMTGPGWDSAGRLLMPALSMQSNLWRFSPQPKPNP